MCVCVCLCLCASLCLSRVSVCARVDASLRVVLGRPQPVVQPRSAHDVRIQALEPVRLAFAHMHGFVLEGNTKHTNTLKRHEEKSECGSPMRTNTPTIPHTQTRTGLEALDQIGQERVEQGVGDFGERLHHPNHRAGPETNVRPMHTYVHAQTHKHTFASAIAPMHAQAPTPCAQTRQPSQRRHAPDLRPWTR